MERTLEQILFASRWLLAPLYFGLSLVLLLLAALFFRELVHLALAATMLREVDVILAALTLIDLALIGGLVVMVMLSGYENFISKLDQAAAGERIAWLGKLDTGTLKLKVAASIVAISSIQLLKGFMEVNALPDDKLLWMVVMHLTFVVSALMLAVMERLMAGTGKAR